MWALTPAGNFNMVHRFPCGGNPCPRGSSPISLVQDAKGNLFGVAGGGPQLNPFLADASGNISADFSGVPEPAAIVLAIGFSGVPMFLRRRA